MVLVPVCYYFVKNIKVKAKKTNFKNLENFTKLKKSLVVKLEQQLSFLVVVIDEL